MQKDDIVRVSQTQELVKVLAVHHERGRDDRGVYRVRKSWIETEAHALYDVHEVELYAHETPTYSVQYMVTDGEGTESGPYVATLQCDGSQESCELLVLERAQRSHTPPVQIVIESITKK